MCGWGEMGMTAQVCRCAQPRAAPSGVARRFRGPQAAAYAPARLQHRADAAAQCALTVEQRRCLVFLPELPTDIVPA